ncbi:hypothetical protein [Nocardia rhizosphaerae]|uniref:Uncharacterized protein n=1 Tax=Nocardia rhizosphaerae TaxID=1691571 RepID=A0ABV8L063_9NOCA
MQASQASGYPLRTGGELAASLFPEKAAAALSKTGTWTPGGFNTGISRVTPLIGLFTVPLSIEANMAGGDSFERAATREAVGFGAGLAAGAATGAVLGSFFPGVGTVTGMAIGAGVSAVATYLGSKGADYVLPEEYSNGGLVTRPGGLISGPGGPTDDLIPAWVSNGEYVVNAESASRYGALLGAINSGTLGVESSSPVEDSDFPQNIELNAGAMLLDGVVAGLSGGVSGAMSGVQQGGLVGGLTGSLRGAASSAGSQVGSSIGAAIGTAVGGPVGTAVGSALGSVLGSEVAGTAADVISKPIEYAAETAKEVVGTGFGLVDLAEGVGGHTARGDIYNFNGMDPKSAAVAVERVRRRRVLAQQRGGGMGR